MIMNQAELAERLGVTSRRVRQLEAAGIITAKGRGEYQAEESERHYQIYAARDLDAAEAQLVRAEAKMNQALAAFRRAKDDAKKRTAAGPLGQALDLRVRAIDLICAIVPESGAELIRTAAKSSTSEVFAEIFTALGIIGICDTV
ncbi:hypothetical protein VRZ08_00090 [Rhodopseudomonas sp. G2_2311]|uniref:hypothetical protein n=1 Tax=Rhodopseudomonas sp. G2_2311 TaxID=3114287 RepID=UPI0039C717A7